MIKAQIKATGKITAALSVMVERAYAQAIKAKAQGTRTVAPKATYLRCSQLGHCSRVSEPAPESQKKKCLME
jgi:hypothetical protein